MSKHKQIPHRAKVHLLEDRLKTLEDKVKFIMNNYPEIAVRTLQDLWDEENKIDMSSCTNVPREDSTYTNAGNKLCTDGYPNNAQSFSCTCYCHQAKNLEFWGGSGCIHCQGFEVSSKMEHTEPPVKELEASISKIPTIDDEKIEEIIENFEDIGRVMMSDASLMHLKSWLRDKLKEL